MKRLVTAALLASVSVGMAQAEEKRELLQQSKGIMKEFMESLKGELQSAMKSGGPVHAIDTCHRVAPGIATEKSRNGWQVGRTSLKVRNPDNAPDAWELAALQKFEERKAAGEPVESMVFHEVVEEDGKKYFRVMKPIPTGKVCVKCHGSEIPPKVEAKLNELYPGDKARGFSEGDIRGAFTLKKQL